MILLRLTSPGIFSAVAFALAIRKTATVPTNYGLNEALMQNQSGGLLRDTSVCVRFATALATVAIGSNSCPGKYMTLLLIMCFFLFPRSVSSICLERIWDLQIAWTWTLGTGRRQSGRIRSCRRCEALYQSEREKCLVTALYYGLRDLHLSIEYVIVPPWCLPCQLKPGNDVVAVDLLNGIVMTKTVEDIGLIFGFQIHLAGPVYVTACFATLTTITL